jgi:hypothetical protein
MRSAVERRTEPREPVSGEVHLRESQSHGAPFAGELLDIAKTGFRARHTCLALASGELVEFRFACRCGIARTMWTRIIDDHAETGFRICEEGQ